MLFLIFFILFVYNILQSFQMITIILFQYLRQIQMKKMIFPECKDTICQEEVAMTTSQFEINLRQNFSKLLIQKTPTKNISSKQSIQTNYTYRSNFYSEKETEEHTFDGQSRCEIASFRQSTSEKVDQPTSTNVDKQIFQSVIKSYQFFQSKLISHFTSTIKIDKYLRLICSIIKTWRSYYPKTRLNTVYKQLILARRVIRWQSKYQTLIYLLNGQKSKGMLIFKLMQLMGDATDLIAFWLKTINKGTTKSQKIIAQLDQLQSNFYFTQCSIWFFIYIYRYLELRKKICKGKEEAEEKTRKMNEYRFRVIKYLMDIITSYNNSSLKKIIGEVNHKLSGYLTFLSSIIGILLLWK